MITTATILAVTLPILATATTFIQHCNIRLSLILTTVTIHQTLLSDMLVNLTTLDGTVKPIVAPLTASTGSTMVDVRWLVL